MEKAAEKLVTQEVLHLQCTGRQEISFTPQRATTWQGAEINNSSDVMFKFKPKMQTF